MNETIDFIIAISIYLWFLVGGVIFISSCGKYNNVILNVLKACLLMGPVGTFLILIALFFGGFIKFIDWSFDKIFRKWKN